MGPCRLAAGPAGGRRRRPFGHLAALLLALILVVVPARPASAISGLAAGVGGPGAGQTAAMDQSGVDKPALGLPIPGGNRSAGAEDAATLEAGGRLFAAHCVGCHVGGGNVIRRGRTLRQAALERAGLADPEAIARIAAGGIGQMSGYGAVLGEDGARQVAAWVWLQARAGWPRTPRMEPLS